MIAENGRAAFEIGEGAIKTVAATENVVAQDECHTVIADE